MDWLSFFRARTGLEWALYISAPFFLVAGLYTGTIFIPTRSGVSINKFDHPFWFWGAMVFHSLCLIGLIVSLRSRSRNKDRWFPDDRYY